LLRQFTTDGGNFPRISPDVLKKRQVRRDGSYSIDKNVVSFLLT
jgi:hypothetical protein